MPNCASKNEEFLIFVNWQPGKWCQSKPPVGRKRVTEKSAPCPVPEKQPVRSALSTRHPERALQRFRQIKSLQRFASVHGSLHNQLASQPFGSIRNTTSQQTDLQRTPPGCLGRVAVARRQTFRLSCDRFATWRQVAVRLTAPLMYASGRPPLLQSSCRIQFSDQRLQFIFVGDPAA